MQMLIKSPPLEIDSDNPFAGDALNREESANVLTNLLKTINEPFVLSVVSPWGTGKTTFLNMWTEQLRQDGFPVISVNAWENDFTNDPLVTLLGVLGDQITELKLDSGVQERLKKVVGNLQKIGAQILRRAIPVGVKIATHGLIDLPNPAETSLADMAEKFAQDAISEMGKTRETIDSFKTQLTELARIAGKLDEYPFYPLIVIIDELDRCRPTYAIELLEVAKHLFNAKGVIFVLAVDKEQLEQSIKVLYGHGMDVDGYLHRFIDLEYALPKPDKGAYTTVLLDRTGLRGFLMQRRTRSAKLEIERLEKILIELFYVFNFSLRAQEQVTTRLGIVLRTVPQKIRFDPEILSFLICLRMHKYALYTGFVEGTTPVDTLLEYIRTTLGEAGRNFTNQTLSAVLEAQLIYSTCDPYDADDAVEKYRTNLTGRQLNDINRRKAEKIVEVFDELRTIGYTSYLADIVKQIEIAVGFAV